MDRTDLAEKLELIGSIFTIDGVDSLAEMIVPEMSVVKFNSVIIRIQSLLIKTDKSLADKLVAISRGITQEDVDSMNDADYAVALKTAIIRDVIGFFASLPHTDGKK